MRMRILIGTVLSIAALVGAITWVNAQAPGFQRVILQRGDIAVAGREVVMARTEFAPGGVAGRHSHPGDEVAYMLEGSITLEIQGKPSATIKAGESFMIPAGAIHNARNPATTPAKLVATYIVEKGKPLATPAQ